MSHNKGSVARSSFLFLLFSSFVDQGMAGCYFPLEFQGEFLSQSMTSLEIAYTSVSILFDSIPTWGTCHRRLGSHIILTSSSGRNPDVEDCFKCISIVSRSPNVLQLHTNGLEKCHLTEEAAKASCPSRQEIRERKSSEMMLYKTRGFYGGSAITRTYCPLNGRYKFTYSINDGTEDDLECHEPVSEAGDCPTGYKFDLHFRGCSFPNFDMSFQCLASWAGDNGETYMSLLDTKLPQLGEEARPRYRCALFKEDPDTGLTHVALSSDSTCTNHLYSSQDGYETLHLEKLEPAPPTTTSTTEPEVPSEPTCSFPEWMQGKWEDLTINGGELTYRDESNFVTYRGKCLESIDDRDENGSSGSRYLLHLQTDCGSPSYNCALFHRRDSNVMEFQLGISSSNKGGQDLSAQLCSSENFTPSQWLTLGRTKIEDPPRCPLVGEFTGILPDAEGLCARSYADCNNPEVMFYTVFNCHNASEVYEEREYLCYGQWQEEETGLVYTYTERRDIPGKECFVGVTLDDDHNIVTEAGANCERGHQPQKYGMTLKRVGTCPTNSQQDEVVTTTKQPRVISTTSTERPISPRLSTVQSVVIDGRVTSPGSSSISVEQIVEEIEEEAEEKDIYDKEFEDRNRHRNVSTNKKHHRHHRPQVRPASPDYSDILSNEIPGSSGARQIRTHWVLQCLVSTSIIVASLLLQRQFH